MAELAEGHLYVTLEQLKNCPLGWKIRELLSYDLNTSLPNYSTGTRDITQEDVDEINRILIKYDINTPNRIAHFLAQCHAETGGGYSLVEQYSGNDIFAFFKNKYEVGKTAADLGNTTAGDGTIYRGGGAIQLTGRAAYEAFSDYIKNPKIATEGVLYVGQNYYWEAAGYYWSVYKPSTSFLK